MAVPTSGAKLSDVKSNIESGGGGTVTSLKDAIDNEADSGSYHPTYYTAPATSLKEFRGYNHVTTTPIGAPTAISAVIWKPTIANFLVTWSAGSAGTYPLDYYEVWKKEEISGTYTLDGTSLVISKNVTASWGVTWFFKIRAKDTNGAYSDFSNEIYECADVGGGICA